MSVKHARVVSRRRVKPGTTLTVSFDTGQRVVLYVVEDLGDIGAGGRRLLRVSTDREPGAPDAVEFDLPAELAGL